MNHLIWGQATDVGLVRKRNEDAVFTLGLTFGGETTHAVGLFIVANGSGGEIAGAVAANLVISVTSAYLWQSMIAPIVGHKTDQSPADVITTAIQTANLELLQLQTRDVNMKSTGSTIDVVLILNDMVYIGHVGNSRVYLMTPTEITQLTEDHDLLSMLIKRGHITKEEAKYYPMRYVLYRVLGQSEDLEVDILTRSFDPEALFLLCTDGLTKKVEPDQIAEIVRNASDPQTACDQLIALANANGGEDNTAVIVVGYHSATV